MARIMIVDDSMFMRISLKAIVESAGHSVVGVASNGDDVIRLYRELRPAVITLDINLEGMDGLSVLKELMAETPKPIVLMISADKQKATLDQANALGAAGFIGKPFDPKEIVRIIQKVCAQPA